MTYAFVASADAGASASATTITRTVTYAAGENVVIAVYFGTSSTTVTLADGTNTYTQVGSNIVDAASGSRWGAVFYARNVAAGTVTITATFTAAQVSRAIKYWRYTGLADVAGQTAGGQGQTSPGTGADAVTSGNVTPSSQPAMLWGLTSSRLNVATMTAGTGFTSRGAFAGWDGLQGDTSQSEDKRLTSTSAVAATFTESTNDQLFTFAAVFTEASSGVSAALTGVAGTGGVGTVAPSTAKALTGNQATGAVGNVTGGQTITGVAGTGAAGTLTPSDSVGETGVAGTGAAGTVGPSTAKALTGNAGTGSVGTVSPGNSVPLTGVAGTGAAGTVVPNTTIGLTGVAGTGQVGTVSPSQQGTAALTGVQATGAAGNLTPATSTGDTGVSGTGGAGTVGPGTAVGLTGAQATGAAGTSGVAVSVALTGVQATGQVGSVTVQSTDVTVALTGVGATGQVGTVTAVGGDTISVSGQDGAGTRMDKWRYYADDQPEPAKPRREAPRTADKRREAPPVAAPLAPPAKPKTTKAVLCELKTLADERVQLVEQVQAERVQIEVDQKLLEAEAALLAAIEQELEDDDNEAIAIAMRLLEE